MAKMPTSHSVKTRLREYQRVGKQKFLEKYANGRGALTYFILFEDELYDTKAIWAASHRPPVSPRAYSPTEASSGILALGFACITSTQAAEFGEGKRIFREATRFQRSPELVKAAKAELGYSCMVCGFNFSDTYGESYIECHHLTELAEDFERVTSVKDIAVVCSNCHRMLHHGGKLRSIQELRAVVEARQGYRPGTDIRA